MKPTVATPEETIFALLERSKRKAERVPLRNVFLQGAGPDAQRTPLAEMVRRHDDRALDLYLLMRAVVSSGDPAWTTRLAAGVWARALHLPAGRASNAAISKVLRRLDETYGLIGRARVRRLVEVTILREDGSRGPYTHPGEPPREPYFHLPFAYWTDKAGWYASLGLNAKAMLLIALSLRDGFELPAERVPGWYGISADTAERGLRDLAKRGLLSAKKTSKSAPLAPEGYTLTHHYTLQPPFGPRGARAAKDAT